MTVQIRRLDGWRKRYRPERGAWQWDRPFVIAEVDGLTVTATGGRGWSCTCADPSCAHVDLVAAHIAPNLLAAIDEENAQPPTLEREKNR